MACIFMTGDESMIDGRMPVLIKVVVVVFMEYGMVGFLSMGLE